MPTARQFEGMKMTLHKNEKAATWTRGKRPEIVYPINHVDGKGHTRFIGDAPRAVKDLKEAKMTKERNRVEERIERDRIVLDGSGQFPRKLLFVEPHGREKEYEIRKTSKGGYLLNR
jgi:hypothetical protein